MLLCEACPFIRFAQELTYSPTGKRVCPGDSRIFYVLSGSGSIAVQGETFSMRERTFVLINTGIPYQITSDRLLKMIVLNFDYTFERSGIRHFIPPLPCREAGDAPYPRRESFEDSQILNDFIVLNDMSVLLRQLREILDTCTTQKIHYREYASCALKQLLITAIRSSSLSSTRVSRTASQLIQYLQEHYSEPISSAQLAETFNYHANHINRIMRGATGITVHKYLINYRISMSKGLLIDTDLSIEQIAVQVGFESAAYYSLSFKKLMGCSPSLYRRLQREYI